MHLSMWSIGLAYLLMASLPTSNAAPSPSKPHGTRSPSTGYGTITTVSNGSIIRATINNPPVNLWDSNSQPISPPSRELSPRLPTPATSKSSSSPPQTQTIPSTTLTSTRSPPLLPSFHPPTALSLVSSS